MQHLYHMHDQNPDGMFRCSEADAPGWNSRGHGIFITVNQFAGERRISNLKKIIAWAIDLDSGTKESMREKISAGLRPSLEIETKRGYHIWFLAKDGTPNRWKQIMLDRLVPFYGADKNARDLCRVLRAPGYLHLKNPAEPFLIREVNRWNVSYSQSQMLRYYPDCSEPERKEFMRETKKVFASSGNFWENVWRLDCIDALTRISGDDFVNGEVFTFRKNSNGKHNIFVNGKSTSCFVDENFRIGSLSGGGPSIYQWLRWYGHSPKKSAEIIGKFFPEVLS